MNVNAISEIFRNSVNQAQEYAKKTKDDGQKGLIYATLALAMANTGIVNYDVEAKEETAAPQVKTTREDLKPKAAKKFKEKKAEPAATEAKKDQEEKPETKKNDDDTDEKAFGAEWTDEAVEHFAKETEFIQEHQGKLYEMYYSTAKEEGKSDEDADTEAQQQTIEFFNSEIERATSSACKTQDDINPMNIKYIVEFLKAVERGEDPAEGAYLPF